MKINWRKYFAMDTILHHVHKYEICANNWEQYSVLGKRSTIATLYIVHRTQFYSYSIHSITTNSVTVSYTLYTLSSISKGIKMFIFQVLKYSTSTKMDPNKIYLFVEYVLCIKCTYSYNGVLTPSSGGQIRFVKHILKRRISPLYTL